MVVAIAEERVPHAAAGVPVNVNITGSFGTPTPLVLVVSTVAVSVVVVVPVALSVGLLTATEYVVDGAGEAIWSITPVPEPLVADSFAVIVQKPDVVELT